MHKPSNPREITRRVAEHEVFLAFQNDADAELFWEWWENVGFYDFRAWAEKQTDVGGTVARAVGSRGTETPPRCARCGSGIMAELVLLGPVEQRQPGAEGERKPHHAICAARVLAQRLEFERGEREPR